MQSWLIEHYKITVQPAGDGYRAVSQGGDVGTGRSAGEAVVACVLKIKGLEDVQIVA